MDLIVYYNGELIKNSDVPFSIYNQGFLYGDGACLKFRIYNTSPFLLKDHINDFFYTNDKLDISLSITAKTIETTIKVLLEVNSLNNANVMMITTRGKSLADLSVDIQKIPNILIMVNPVQEADDSLKYKGVTVCLSERRAPSRSIIDRQVYSLSQQREILGLIEAKQRNAIDALLLNLEGQVCECANSSVFIIKNSILYTPAVECGVRDRPIRRFILKIARHLKYRYFEGIITLNELFNADECFLVSNDLEVLPVVMIDKHMISDGIPGKITNQIIYTFQETTRGDGFGSLL